MLKTVVGQILGKNPNLSVLNQLFVDGMDSNQIWAQLEMINSNYLDSGTFFLIPVASNDSNGALGSSNGTLNDSNGVLDGSIDGPANSNGSIHSENEESENDSFELDETRFEEEESMDSDNQSGSTAGSNDDFDQEFKGIDEASDDEDNLKNFEHDFENDQEIGMEKRSTKKSIVDDEFFSLEEFNRFADQSEAHDMKMAKQGNDESEQDDDDDMFAAEKDMYDDLDDDDNANDIRYEDFFGKRQITDNKTEIDVASDDNDDMMMDEDVASIEENYDEQMRAIEEIDYKGDAQDLFEQDEEEEDAKEYSTFERQQFKTSKEIEKFERELVAEKGWALKGEVNAAKRPKDSLLDQELDVDIAARPVPEITEETTQTIEDLVLQRIKDKAYDDVVRKVATETKFNVNRRWELDDQKSKKSLAELYEAEKEGETEAEKKLAVQHQEIDSQIKTLFGNLDALANWHYSPPEATLQVQVLSNVSTITMEEKIPLAVSSAQTLAPSEVHKGVVTKSEAELDSTDKARLRKAAKKQHGIRKKQKAAASSKYANSKGDAVKHLMKQKNVTMVIGRNDSKHLKSNAKQVKVGDSLKTKKDTSNIASLKL